MPKRSDFWANFYGAASKTSQAVGSEVAVNTARQMLAEILAMPDKEKARAIRDLQMQGEKQRQAHVGMQMERAPELQKVKLETEKTRQGYNRALTIKTLADIGKTSGGHGAQLSPDAHDKLVESMLSNPESFDTIPATMRAQLLPALGARGFQYLGKPLPPESQKIIANSTSGLSALDKLEKEMSGFSGKARLVAATMPGSPFARTLKTARGEISDVITRLRTGAALNEQEQAFYNSQMPSLLDLSDPGTIEYKMSLFRNLFTNLARQHGRQATATAPKAKTAMAAPSSGVVAPAPTPAQDPFGILGPMQ